MQADVASGKLHPMQAKKNLAWTIVRDFHSAEEADTAAENWAKSFSRRGVSEDVPVVKVSLAAEGLMAAVDGGVRRFACRSCWCWRGWRVLRVRRRGSWRRMQ